MVVIHITLRVFIRTTDVIDVGIPIMFAFTLSIPVIGIQMVLMHTMQAMGKGLPALIVSLSRQGLFYFPAIIILNNMFQFSGFIYAQAIADVMATFLSVGLYFQAVSRFENTVNFCGMKQEIVPEI